MRSIETRRSVRKYKKRDIPDETVMALLESGRLAPSGSNTQPWRFIIVRDPAIAIEKILLEAEELGLGACWTAWFNQKDMRECLGIPPDKYVCGVVTVGYSDEHGAPQKRKSLDPLVMYDKWKEI